VNAIDETFELGNELRTGEESAETRRLDYWLELLVSRGGSDLLLVPGAPACILHDGAVEKIGQRELEASEI